MIINTIPLPMRFNPAKQHQTTKPSHTSPKQLSALPCITRAAVWSSTPSSSSLSRGHTHHIIHSVTEPNKRIMIPFIDYSISFREERWEAKQHDSSATATAAVITVTYRREKRAVPLQTYTYTYQYKCCALICCSMYWAGYRAHESVECLSACALCIVTYITYCDCSTLRCA